jgi:DNA-binding transcriptional regulator YhcF (GntR family)
VTDEPEVIITAPNPFKAFGAVPYWVTQLADDDGKPISPRAVQVYLALTYYAWRPGGAFPGRKALAARCGDCETKTITRAIAELRSLGAIRVHERRDTSGRQSTHRYELIEHPPRKRPS